MEQENYGEDVDRIHDQLKDQQADDAYENARLEEKKIQEKINFKRKLEIFNNSQKTGHSDGSEFTLAESVCQATTGGCKFKVGGWLAFERAIEFAYQLGKLHNDMHHEIEVVPDQLLRKDTHDFMVRKEINNGRK